MSDYELIFLPKASKKFKKLIKNNKKLEAQFIKVFSTLQVSPFELSLSSHKVNLSSYGEVFSSRVTGDIRIIWKFYRETLIAIAVLDIGGHSGSTGVYK